MVEPNSDGGLAALDQLVTDAQKLEALVERTIQALRKRGYDAPADLSTTAHTVRQQAETLRQNSAKPNIKASHKLQQFEELVRTSALITSSLDLTQVLEDVIDTIIRLTQAERTYLMLRDKQSGDLSIRTARNWDQKTLDAEAAGFSRGVIDAAIEQREPILTDNAQSDPRFAGAKSVVGQGLRSIMCIPMVLRDEIVGVLYADNRLGSGNFSPDAIPIISAFANQAAIAIQNARAFGQVKADLDEAKVEVERLRIQIDQSKLQSQLGEITETEYFQNLQMMASNIRRRGRAQTE